MGINWSRCPVCGGETRVSETGVYTLRMGVTADGQLEDLHNPEESEPTNWLLHCTLCDWGDDVVYKGDAGLEPRVDLQRAVALRLRIFPNLREYEAEILYDWSNRDEHLWWALHAHPDVIIAWAADVRRSAQ